MILDDSEFQPMTKIPRFYREVTITEKIDGTNGQIYIFPFDSDIALRYKDDPRCLNLLNDEGHYAILVGSRTRWLGPEKRQDNYGFWRWVYDNAPLLVAELGLGRHYGEWFGQSINRGYGLSEKRFALFRPPLGWGTRENRICDAVQELYTGPLNSVFTDDPIYDCLCRLEEHGSCMVPGYMNPEGIVIFHHASRHLYKVTLEDDQQAKGVKEV